ncbi:MAG: hypothetical protein ACUVRD_09015 [Bacteroidia bacterium]
MPFWVVRPGHPISPSWVWERVAQKGDSHLLRTWEIAPRLPLLWYYRQVDTMWFYVKTTQVADTFPVWDYRLPPTTEPLAEKKGFYVWVVLLLGLLGVGGYAVFRGYPYLYWWYGMFRFRSLYRRDPRRAAFFLKTHLNAYANCNLHAMTVWDISFMEAPPEILRGLEAIFRWEREGLPNPEWGSLIRSWTGPLRKNAIRHRGYGFSS